MNENISSREEEERDLRAALQYAVGKICENEDALDSGGARMSRSAVAALAELTYQYATTSLSNDLVWFARHASRRTISVDDVKLVARKNPNHLLEQLESFTDQQKLQKGNHTMEKVQKEKKGTPKKQRKSTARSSARKTKSTNRKSASDKEEFLRKQQARARIVDKINENDTSSEDSESEKLKIQDMDIESSDSDMEKGLQARLEQLRKSRFNKKSPSKDIDQDCLDSSDSEDMENNSRGFKRLNKRMHLSPQITSNNSFDSDSLGDLGETNKENCQNAPSPKTSLEVIELKSQDDEF